MMTRSVRSPFVRMVSPESAPGGGLGRSIPVTVSGTGFTPGVRVFFGAHEAAGAQLVDPHTLLVPTVNVLLPEVVEVIVVLPDGRRASLPGAFAFVEEGRRLSIAEIPGVVTFRGSRRRP